MKTSLILLAVLTSAALAQQPAITPPTRVRAVSQPPQIQGSDVAEAFAVNYLVTLSVTENDKPVTELVIATARAKFSANTVEPSFTLEGLLAPQDDGTILVTYVFATEVAVPVATQQTVGASGEPGVVKTTSVQFKTQSAQAQVRLKLGESLNVLRTGQRTYRLAVSKLPEGGAKAH